jgi:hypothetical protein
VARLPVGAAFRITNRILLDNPDAFAALIAVEALSFSLWPIEGRDFLLPAALGVLVLAMPVTIATIAAANQACHGEHVRLADALGTIVPRYLPVIGAVVCSGLMVGAGLILLVIPGVIAAALQFVALPVCVIERLGPVASLKRSVALCRGELWRVLGIAAACVAVTLAVSIANAELLAGSPFPQAVLSWIWDALSTVYGLVLSVVVYSFLTTTTASSASTPSA